MATRQTTNAEQPREGKLFLEVVTPLRAVLAEQVDEVILTGAAGEFGILPGHLPMLAALDAGGKLAVLNNGDRRLFVVSGGFAEVYHDRITVMTEECEGVDEIDVEKARAALKEAEEAYNTALHSTDVVEEDLVERHQAELRRQRMKLLMGEGEER